MAQVKRYGVVTLGGGALFLSDFAEGQYVTHADYVAREAELVGRIKALREGLAKVCARYTGYTGHVASATLADDDAAAVGGEASDG